MDYLYKLSFHGGMNSSKTHSAYAHGTDGLITLHVNFIVLLNARSGILMVVFGLFSYTVLYKTAKNN